MKRGIAFVAVVALTVVLAALLGRIPEALAQVEAFKVTGIRLEGARYLTEEEAMRTLALGEEASLWDDVDTWESRLSTNPLVDKVQIHRRFPGTLVLEVEEPEPVALFPHPVLEPVDRSGRVLPIDPAVHRLDLPVMAWAGSADGRDLTPAQRQLLAHEIDQLAQGDPEFLARISDITLDARGDIAARLWDPSLTIHFRPGLTNRRIQEGLRVYSDAVERFSDNDVQELDLRYEDQVVVRLGRARSR